MTSRDFTNLSEDSNSGCLSLFFILLVSTLLLYCLELHVCMLYINTRGVEGPR